MNANTSIVHSQNIPQGQSGELLRFSRQEVGWEWMSLVVRRLAPGDTLPLQTQDEEMALVLLGGECAADWGEGEVLMGGRKNVFDGLPYALYLPSSNRVVLKAESVCEFAECKVPSTARLQPRLITPKDISTNLRGGENASRVSTKRCPRVTVAWSSSAPLTLNPTEVTCVPGASQAKSRIGVAVLVQQQTMPAPRTASSKPATA